MKNTVPEPYGSLIDGVCAKDRAHFESNPGIDSYIRAYVPGEFYPLNVTSKFVIVHRLTADLRIREPMAEPIKT